MPASAYACRDCERDQQDSAAPLMSSPMLGEAPDGGDEARAAVASLGDALAIAEDIRSCLVRRVQRMLGDWGGSEDAVQEAIILLCARWQRLGKVRTVRAWLHQTVRRKALEMRRRRRLRPLSACAEPASPPGAGRDPRLDIIAGILGRIQPEMRRIINDLWVRGRDIDDVAVDHGLSVGTLRKRLSRIRALARAQCAGHRQAMAPPPGPNGSAASVLDSDRESWMEA